MSYQQNGNAPAAPATNGRAATGRTVDWSGYPALFQRVAAAPEARPRVVPVVPVKSEPAAPTQPVGGIREAFLAFCQAALHTPEATAWTGRHHEPSAASRALAAIEAFGFTREDLHRLGFGLYTSPAAIRDDLRSMGFTEAAIDAARLVSDDDGRPRTELTGCVIVPLSDEFLLVSIDAATRAFNGTRLLDGAPRTDVPAYGLAAAFSPVATRRAIVLVEDILEMLLLQARGVSNVAAVGGAGQDLTPRRWEELARLGVSSVTLAFRRDERQIAQVRDALVGALRARSAPEIFAVNPFPAGERSAVDVLRRFGRDACTAALEARTLAFHDKDFGVREVPRPVVAVAPVAVPQPAPLPVPTEPYYRTAFRKHLADLTRGMTHGDRPFAEETIDLVTRAILDADFARAQRLIAAASLESTPIAAQPAARPDWFWTTWAGGYAVPRHYQQSMERRPNPAMSAAEIVDRLARSPEPAEVPAHLAGYSGKEAPTAVEWIVDASPRGRLTTLCERIADACDRRPNQSFVVVCCEHTERQLLLALATHVAARYSNGQGLTVEEVRSRLAGVDPTNGYRDKPWLADEAVDRLRLWSSRLTFVACPPTAAGRAAVEQAVEAARALAPIGGVYFDALPAYTQSNDVSATAWLCELAGRCGGLVIAAVPTVSAVWSTPVPTPPAPSFDRTLARTETGREILATLTAWTRRERDETK